jgi:predicted MFS family arabinose efflux permease
VRVNLHASDAEFGVLVVLFGVGAVAGLLVIQRFKFTNRLRATRLGSAALGLIVAGFSLAPAIGLAFVGAVFFGAAAAFTLASGMGLLQSDLDGQERTLAFAVFHIVIRAGLALAAIAAGVAAELVGNVHWPVVGTLEPTRLVLLCSGLLVFVASSRVRLAGEQSPHGSHRLHDGPRPEGI